jgi:hypothetical protein
MSELHARDDPSTKVSTLSALRPLKPPPEKVSAILAHAKGSVSRHPFFSASLWKNPHGHDHESCRP